MSGGAQLAAGCPPESLLLELTCGALAGDGLEQALLHLDGCRACSEIVAELACSSAAEEHGCVGPCAGDRAQGGLALRPGALLERFVILGELGRGGMGVVYAAFDPALDRKVALKLVRPGPAPASLPASWRPEFSPAPRAAARAPGLRSPLLVEAQALARLSHPNVVTIYEARAVGEQLYLAMELIPGQSLRELASRRPPWRELVRRYCEAGRGLQAAHDAGLVHRDFKPDNALLGDDGRVRVTDFGLAQHHRARGEGPVGTPGYLAPELWRGQPADARSDQFSFAVSLWEALCGARPFPATGGPALREQVRRGPEPLLGWRSLHARLSLRARHSAAPTSLLALLGRALQLDPAHRHPSMRALVDALEQSTQARGSGPLFAVLAICLIALGAGSHAWWQERLDPSRAIASSTAAAAPLEPALCAAPLAAETAGLPAREGPSHPAPPRRRDPVRPGQPPPPSRRIEARALASMEPAASSRDAGPSRSSAGSEGGGGGGGSDALGADGESLSNTSRSLR